MLRLILIAILIPFSAVAFLLCPSWLHRGAFYYYPAPVKRAWGTFSLRKACSDVSGSALKRVAIGYLRFSEEAAEPGKLSELISANTQLLCLQPEAEEPLPALMWTAVFVKGNDSEIRKAATLWDADICPLNASAFPPSKKVRIVSACRAVGLSI